MDVPSPSQPRGCYVSRRNTRAVLLFHIIIGILLVHGVQAQGAVEITNDQADTSASSPLVRGGRASKGRRRLPKNGKAAKTTKKGASTTGFAGSSLFVAPEQQEAEQQPQPQLQAQGPQTQALQPQAIGQPLTQTLAQQPQGQEPINSNPEIHPTAMAMDTTSPRQGNRRKYDSDSDSYDTVNEIIILHKEHIIRESTADLMLDQAMSTGDSKLTSVSSMAAVNEDNEEDEEDQPEPPTGGPDPLIASILDMDASFGQDGSQQGRAPDILMPEEDPLAEVVDEINLLGDITGDVVVSKDLEQQAVPPAQNFVFSYNTDYFEFGDPTVVAKFRPGQSTCGFLKAPLGYIPGEDFPSVKIYFCIRFANIQPPSNGWLAVHCGGPGTLSDCAVKMEGSYLSEDMQKTYNTISFDQRGMGRSWPSFAHDECTFGVIRKGGRTFVDPDEEDMYGSEPQEEEESLELRGLYIDSVDVQNVAQVEQYLEQAKDRVINCWSCDTCGFNFESKSTDEQYHFLDYSGTQEVVQDLELFRSAFRIPKLSLLGVSYGTQIFSTYASMFPTKVDRLVLDANMSPDPDWLHLATSYARGGDSRLDYLDYTCSTKNAREAGSCGIPSLAKCFQDVTVLMQQEKANGNMFEYHQALGSHLLYMSYDEIKNNKHLQDLCEAGADGDIWQFHSVLQDYLDTIMAPAMSASTPAASAMAAPHEGGGSPQANQDAGASTPAAPAMAAQNGGSSSQGPCQSCPTSNFAIFGNPEYDTLMGNSMYNTVAIGETMVLAQSLSGGSHDMAGFMKQLQHIDTLYPGLGTHEPAKRFLYVYAMGFAWPEPHPIAPASDYNIARTGIVSGQLYDPNTPYEWTQEMKSSFPAMTLLTSQWMEHGLSQHDSSNHYSQSKGGKGSSGTSASNINSNRNCFGHITHYLETGEVGVVDGTVCRTGYHNFHDQEENPEPNRRRWR